MYGKLSITLLFWHLAIFLILFWRRLMNIFLTQFWTEKLLIHKPQPRRKSSPYQLGSIYWSTSNLELSWVVRSIQYCVTWSMPGHSHHLQCVFSPMPRVHPPMSLWKVIIVAQWGAGGVQGHRRLRQLIIIKKESFFCSWLRGAHFRI